MWTARTILAALLLSVGLVSLGTMTASAGGPTSVQLSAPSTGSTASLRNGTRRYLTLEQKLFDVDPVGSGPQRGTGLQVTATWLIHDVTPWRVDDIHVGADGTVLVSTTTGAAGLGVDPSTSDSWGRVRDPETVVRILDRLGLTQGQASAGDAVAALPRAGAAESQLAGTPSAESRSAFRSAASAGRWVVGLAVLSTALALPVGRLVRRRRAETAGPWEGPAEGPPEGPAQGPAVRDRGTVVDVLG